MTEDLNYIPRLQQKYNEVIQKELLSNLNLNNIFEVQSDVARKIALALKTELSPEEKSRISQVPTENLEAYTLYKQGKDKYLEYNTQGFEESINFFKKALYFNNIP